MSLKNVFFPVFISLRVHVFYFSHQFDLCLLLDVIKRV